MTRWGILMTYKIVGPLLLLVVILEELGKYGFIDLSERTPIGSLLYTPRVMLIMALALASPIIVILGGVILYRFGSDWPVTLPALLAAVSLSMIVLIAIFDPPEPLQQIMSDTAGVVAIAAMIAAVWAGWFAKAEPLG